jgi:hypothetical protein
MLRTFTPYHGHIPTLHKYLHQNLPLSEVNYHWHNKYIYNQVLTSNNINDTYHILYHIYKISLFTITTYLLEQYLFTFPQTHKLVFYKK